MIEMDFFEYKVRNGDTLQSISSRLGMTGEELKLFHNTRCSQIDTVWFDNLNGVQHLFVPQNFKTDQQKEQEKKKLLPPTTLSDSFFLPTYRIQETFENAMEAPLILEYTVQVDIHRNKNEHHHVMTFGRTDFKTNGRTPDDKAGNLSLSCMEAIMPIDFILADNGTIARLADHKKMIQKYKEKRIDLEEFFTGDISKTYFDTFQDHISDQDYFLNQFRSTLLFQTLFPKMDWFHRKSVWQEKFYFLQNSFPVQCSLDSEYESEDRDFVTTVLKGKIIDPCSLQELKRGVRFEQPAEEPISGEINLQYTTHTEDKTLSRAESSLNLWHEDILVQKHNITINTMII